MATKTVPPKQQQQLQAQYNVYKDTLEQLTQRVGSVEQDAEEHRLVLETLSTVPADRKCFRMINGVMVERKVQDVIPTLQTNHEGLKKVLDELAKQVKAKHDEFSSWKTKNKIQVVQQP